MQLLRCPIGLLVSTFSVLELQGQPFDYTWVFSFWVPCIEFKSSCFLREHFTNWAIFTASKYSILSSYKCLIDLSPKYPFKWRVVVLANSAIFYPKEMRSLWPTSVSQKSPHGQTMKSRVVSTYSLYHSQGIYLLKCYISRSLEHGQKTFTFGSLGNCEE